jgi:alkylation response protein AidB-like acyl-CoA dehydrogenase
MSTHPTSSEHQALHDSATRFLAGLADFARQRQRQQTGDWRLDRALWHQFGHLGWLGVMMPEAYGGLGLPAGDALTIMQAMGAHVSEPYAASLAAAQLLQDLGSTAQQARWLPACALGRPCCCRRTPSLALATRWPACKRTRSRWAMAFAWKGVSRPCPGGRTPMAGWFRRAAPAPWAMP